MRLLLQVRESVIHYIAVIGANAHIQSHICKDNGLPALRFAREDESIRDTFCFTASSGSAREQLRERAPVQTRFTAKDAGGILSDMLAAWVEPSVHKMTDTQTSATMQDDTDNGLVTAWLLDGKGGGKRIDWQTIDQWQPSDGLLWMHLDYSHANTERWLQAESGISPIIQSVLISEETRPRCELFENGLLAILRGVNLNPGSDPEDMVSVRLWIEGTRIISCRRRRIASIRDVENALARNVGPRTQGGFLAHLSEQLGDKVDAVIESLENETELLEDLLLTEESSSLRPQLSAIRRTVIHLRRYLAPQRDALKRLQAMEIEWMSQNARSRLNEAADQTQRYLEGLDAIRDQSLVTQEELSQKLSEQTEKRMYLLSIITTVFLPLGFLTGLLGINVGGMPGTDSALAFWIVCLLAIIMGAGTLWILRINRWF